MLCDSLCAFAHFIAGARAHGIALDWVASGLGGVRLRQQRAARESGHSHNVRTPCIACMICCDGALRNIDTPICKAPFRLALTVFLRTVGGVKSGFYSEMVAAFCYRRFTASLSFQWDLHKTTPRQLQDNYETTTRQLTRQPTRQFIFVGGHVPSRKQRHFFCFLKDS